MLKLFLLLTLLVLSTTAYPRDQQHGHDHNHEDHGHDHSDHQHVSGGSDNAEGQAQGLEHFKREELNEDFQNYRIPASAGCDQKTQNCLQGVHQHAQRCLQMWMEAKGEEIQRCETDNVEVNDADKAWQEASFKWHKALQRCLAGEQPDSDAGGDDESSETDAFFALRKKRSADSSEEEAEPDHNRQYSTYQECWREVREHRGHCKQKITDCPALARCYGIGPAPTDEIQARWYNIVKELREDTDSKVRDHRRKLHQCMQLQDEEKLWENE